MSERASRASRAQLHPNLCMKQVTLRDAFAKASAKLPSPPKPTVDAGLCDAIEEPFFAWARCNADVALGCCSAQSR